MSCDDNVCDRCGRVCRDNPPTDYVAEECCLKGDRPRSGDDFPTPQDLGEVTC